MREREYGVCVCGVCVDLYCVFYIYIYIYVWCGVVWCGVVWCGVVWCGVYVVCCSDMFILTILFYRNSIHSVRLRSLCLHGSARDKKACA